MTLKIILRQRGVASVHSQVFMTQKLQSHIHDFGPGRATVHPDLASR